jgi:protein-S-isoprenylcysteine O-methyltransferase Ste14
VSQQISSETASAVSPLLYRSAVVVYGVACYLFFLGTFLYAIGFVGNLLVPKSIDSGAPVSLIEALTVDLLLLGLFAVQHSVMARPGFKLRWTRLVPQPIERSTYVLASNLLLVLLYWQWRPLPDPVWEVQQPAVTAALWALFASGWLLALISTFVIDHFDLFGLRQVFLFATGKPYSPVDFRTPFLYRVVRHPLMLGFIIAFWAAPVMTWGHLLFASLTTAYIFIGVLLEERDLHTAFGGTYQDYCRQVSMILPWLGRGPKP